MKQMKNLFNPKLFYKFFIILLGVIMFFGYFCIKFLRNRLPRDIPYNLSVWGFMVLLEICIIYFYIAVSFTDSYKKNEIAHAFIDWIYIPIDYFYTYVREQHYTSTFWDRYYYFILRYIKFFTKYIGKLYFIFRIFPRVILVSALLIDVIIYHKLFYVYKVLLIGILLFLARVFIYALRMHKKELIKDLDVVVDEITTEYIFGVYEWDYDNEEDDAPSSMDVSLEKYLELQTRSIVRDGKELFCIYTSKTKHRDMLLKLSADKYHKCKDLTYNKIKDLVNLSVFL